MKRFYLLTILCALLGINQAWGNTHSFNAENFRSGSGKGGDATDVWESVSEDNVTFKLTGRTKYWSDYGVSSQGQVMQLLWTPPTGYSVSVTGLTINCYTQETGLISKTVGYTYYTSSIKSEETLIHDKNLSTRTIDASYFPMGDEGWIKFEPRVNEFLYNIITFTYTRTAHTYIVAFAGNGSSKGSVANVDATYDQDITLAQNGYRKHQYIVNYNFDGGNCDKTADSTLYTFLGWNTQEDGEGTLYEAGQTLTNPNFTAEDGATYTLYAKWSDEVASATVTLPAATPTDENYHFVGWYNGDVFVGIAGTKIIPTSNMTLTARWSDKKIPVFSGEGQTMNVGEGYDGFIFDHTTTKTPSGNPSALFHYEITEVQVTTENTTGSPDGTKVIGVEYDGDKTIIRALNQGTAKITFYQGDDSENKIEGKQSDTYTFTVNKNVTAFTWNEQAKYYYNDTVRHFFKSNQTETAIDVKNSEALVAELVDSALVTYYTTGTSKITVTQAENYKWTGLNEFVEITPVQKYINHVPFVYSEEMYNDNTITIEKEGKYGMKWDESSHLKLGGDGTSIAGVDAYYDGDKYVIIRIEGVPDSISFIYRTNTGLSSSVTSYWYVAQSENGKDWTDIWSNSRNSSDWIETPVKKALDPSTRYIKLCYSGNFAGYFKDVTITEKKQFDAENVDFGDIEINSEVAEKTLTFKHANAGYKVNVTKSGDELFTIDHLTVANTGGDKMGEENFKITFNPSVVGEHKATVTFTDELGNDSVVTLSANVVKKTPVIDPAPLAGDIEVGQTLSNSELYNGSASVPGTFAWQDGDIKPDSTGVYKYNVVFTPEDTENYNTVIIEVEVKVTDTGTAVDNTASEVKATKILRDGQVLILRDGKVYNLNGQEVR